MVVVKGADEHSRPGGRPRDAGTHTSRAGDTSTMGLSRKHPLETHNLCVLQGLKSAPTNRTPYKVGDGPTGRRLLRKLSARGIVTATAACVTEALRMV